MNNDSVEQTTNTGLDTSATATIKQNIAARLRFECMECGVPLDFEYLGGHLDMHGREYHQLDVCECDGEWSDRIIVSIEVSA